MTNLTAVNLHWVGTETIQALNVSATNVSAAFVECADLKDQAGVFAISLNNRALLDASANRIIGVVAQGSSGDWRAAIAGDFPTLNQNTTGSAASFTGSLAGDVTGTQGANTVKKINGVALSGLTTGILKNTTTTGVPSIAIVGTDYAAPTSGSSILYGNGAGGFSNVTLGSGLSFNTGTLNTVNNGTVTSIALTVPTGLTASGSPITTSGTLAITTSLSGIVKGTGTGFTTATAGTDYTVPMTWSTDTASSVTLVANTGHVANGSSLVTYTLPTTSNVGDTFQIYGLGVGGWKVAQNASQNIIFGNQTSTTGTGGSLASTHKNDVGIFRCIVANTTWSVGPSQGNITVT